MSNTVTELIKFEIETLKKREGKNWVKDEEKKSIPYTIETLEKLLTTIAWNNIEEV